MSNYGLAFCSDLFANSLCITQLLSLLINSTLLIFIFHDLIMRYNKEKQINFFVIVCLLMLLSLLSNMVFLFDNDLITFLNLTDFFYNAYFALIVYYICLKVLHYRRFSANYRLLVLALHVCFAIYGLFLIYALILRSIKAKNCKQLWYLIVNGIGLLMSGILIWMCIYYSEQEKKKSEGINKIHVKDPLPSIWRWIFINIMTEVSSLVQSVIFQITTSDTCSFSENENLNIWLTFFFSILTFYMGMIATVVFFRQKYSHDQNKEKKQITIQLSEDPQHQT